MSDPEHFEMGDLVFTLAAQTVAAQKRLDAQYIQDFDDYARLMAPLIGTTAESAALELAPSPYAMLESTIEVQTVTTTSRLSEVRIVNTSFATRYRSQDIQHTMTATVRRVPFTPAYQKEKVAP